MLMRSISLDIILSYRSSSGQLMQLSNDFTPESGSNNALLHRVRSPALFTRDEAHTELNA